MITGGFLAGWALRSAILIVSGVVLMKVLRVKDPAVRLAAWTAMLCVSLAIPILTASLPAMPVKTPPAVVGRPGERAIAPHGPVVTVLRQEAAAPPSAKRFDWARDAMVAYLVGVGVLSLRLCFGLALAVRLRHRSWPTELPGVRESGRIASPVTLGILRPAILLPTDWREWGPQARRRAGARALAHSSPRSSDPSALRDSSRAAVVQPAELASRPADRTVGGGGQRR